MEQGRRTEEDMKQRQDKRGRLTPPPPPSQSENQLHHHLNQQPPPQQKCPRCDSLNTKFCYYNNYSLTQPRYFCKACRRYWTHGGTLRNVPVGGGCRKGKRSRASSSGGGGGENSRSQQPSPPSRQPPRQPTHELIHLPQNSGAGGAPPNLALRDKELGNLATNPAMNSYFSGCGFLSSLSAVQPLIRPPPPQPFSQPPNAIALFGGCGSGSSHLPPLQGPNAPSFGTQNEFYQMGSRDKNIEIEPMYPSDQSLIQPNRPVGSWFNPTLINNPNASNPSFWNSSATNSTTPGSGCSLNSNQWPDLPGYGHPP